MPTGACHRALDPVVGMTGEAGQHAVSRFVYCWASPHPRRCRTATSPARNAGEVT